MWRKIQDSLANYSSEDKQSINKTLAKEKDKEEYASSGNFLRRSGSEIRLTYNAKQIMKALEAREKSLELSAEGRSPSPMRLQITKKKVREEKEIIFGTTPKKMTKNQLVDGSNSRDTRDIERKSSVDASKNIVINIEKADDESSTLDDTFDVVAEALREIERSRNTSPRKPEGISKTVNDGQGKASNLKQKNETHGSLPALLDPPQALGQSSSEDRIPNHRDVQKGKLPEKINLTPKRSTWPEQLKEKIRNNSDDSTSYKRINRSISMAGGSVHENKESKRHEIKRRSALPKKKAVHESIASENEDSGRFPKNCNNHKAVQSDGWERNEIARLYASHNDNRAMLLQENKKLKDRLRKLQAILKSPNVHLRRLLKQHLADGEHISEIMVEKKQKHSLTVTMKMTAVFEVDD